MKRLLSLLTILMLLSCSGDDDNMANTENIAGVWENSTALDTENYPELEEGNYNYVLQFKFLGDRTFEGYSFLRNTENDNIVGYNVQMKGDFTTEADRINLVYDQWNSNTEASEFVSLNELSLIQEDVEWSFDYSVNNEELLFDFDPCGPLENCIGEITLERVEEGE